MTIKEYKIDTPDKMKAWFIWYDEAVKILRNYKMRWAVSLLEDCLKSKKKVIETWIQLIWCIEDFTNNKLENNPKPTK